MRFIQNHLLVTGITAIVFGFLFREGSRRVGEGRITIDSTEISFVEKSFPYITIPLVAKNLGEGFPKDNVVARGLAINLGNGLYTCFDMDLLRWAVAWEGSFPRLVLPAQGSYNDFFKYNKGELPHVPGNPKLATGMYPGWSVGDPSFQEARGKDQETEGLFWGPVPTKIGRWKGVYPHGNTAVLSYLVGTQDILEMPGSVTGEGITVFARTFKTGKSDKTLFLNVAEVSNATRALAEGQVGSLFSVGKKDSVTTVSLNGAQGSVRVIDNRYLVVELPASETPREFTVLVWKGASGDREKFKALAKGFVAHIPDVSRGNPARWKQTVKTRAVLSPDTSAFVTDVVTLPSQNPWGRHVRVADIAFFSGGKAAISTYEGDIWVVEGFKGDLGALTWRRFASGFYEPFSIEIYKDQVFVYAKEGMVRLHDLDGDGEADFYENYCNLMQQSVGTREWAADMVIDEKGDIFIAKGGQVSGTAGVLPLLSGIIPENVYSASTQQSGSVLRISDQGKKIGLIASGLRMPYIGLNRRTGFLTASDQQGNFVPATPIYAVKKGDYFGVPVTKHRAGEPGIQEPITWIPHSVDRSAASQSWIASSQMGPLNNQMVHFSFGLPGVFRVLLDSSSHVLQGGVTNIFANYPAPVIKGEVNPEDGQLYIAGFNNYASNSLGIAALLRLRYTGKASYMVRAFKAGKRGLILSFDSPLEAIEASRKANYTVKRWNYKRTQQYGSGHYKLNGTAGEDILPVLASYLSGDGKSVLLLIPDMKKADQMEVTYTLAARDGKKISDGIWFSLRHENPLKYQGYGFKNVDLNQVNLTAAQLAGMIKSDLPVTVDRGKELFGKVGCIGCHSTGRKTEGMYGPPLQGIYGFKRELADHTFVIADEAYLRESILQPSKKVVKGYNPEMPSFEGILSESDVQSILFYIKTLYQ
jgi:cytochrome c2/glucose/arabinose dehydrogenase